mgnify:CR=1 FL=1
MMNNGKSKENIPKKKLIKKQNMGFFEQSFSFYVEISYIEV